MPHLYAVGGSPSCGKTTLFKKFIEASGGDFAWFPDKKGLVVYSENPERAAIIIGDYSLGTGNFAGTDRLSMAVQEQALAFVKKLPKKTKVFFEGDRLWNNKFFISLEATDIPFTLIELRTHYTELNKRHKERGDTQTEKWLAGRETKLANVRNRFRVEQRDNNNEADLAENLKYLLSLLINREE